ncbi:MAG: c-type cytochrome [Hyphomicrobiaceae bacterium]|nr:c-type cytochrome [Hyphomicrobiaceae bacterium]
MTVSYTPDTTAQTPDLATLKRIFARPTLTSPASDPDAKARLALGARLFRDRLLSRNQSMSCATCHNPNRAFTDGRPRARGNDGTPLDRNTPTLYDVRYGNSFFWDGRASTLEDQARVPLEHPRELNLPLTDAVTRLAAQKYYRRTFDRAFSMRPSITSETVLQSLATYERSLNSPNTRFDSWVSGTTTALSKSEATGFRIFSGKGRCIACHGGWRFTDDKFHDTGLPSTDLGRGAIPGSNAAPHTFKTPSLRQLTQTAPYMHDGSLPTLEAVVDHYNGTRIQRPSLASELKNALGLTPNERRALVAFLKTLSFSSR